VWHPLIHKYKDEIQNVLHIKEKIMNFGGIQYDAANAYNCCVERLQKVLLAAGLDKFTARKQARGAARGILGNALSTELIWTASVAEIREVIRQRATAAADAEIRLLANSLFETVTNRFPSWFKGSTTKSCPDGIGYEVILNG
jgi:thymidylate synthase ThyX